MHVHTQVLNSPQVPYCKVPPLTQEELKRVLDYDPATGIFTWKVRLSNRQKIGDAAQASNCQKMSQYRVTSINKKRYRQNRLAFLWMTGSMPDCEIDHKNGDSLDNSWKNLRKATRQEQGRNTRVSRRSSTGLKGVHLCKITNKYRAKICIDRRSICLGRYDTAEAAHQAYGQAAQKFFGEFARVA